MHMELYSESATLCFKYEKMASLEINILQESSIIAYCQYVATWIVLVVIITLITANLVSFGFYGFYKYIVSLFSTFKKINKFLKKHLIQHILFFCMMN